LVRTDFSRSARTLSAFFFTFF